MPQNEQKKLAVARLNAHQFKELRQQCRPPAVTANTTELEAGYLLGIQTVLRLLEEGWVIEE